MILNNHTLATVVCFIVVVGLVLNIVYVALIQFYNLSFVETARNLGIKLKYLITRYCNIS